MFVDPARAKEYECAVCLNICQDPVQIGCQDHIFCKQCIDQLISIKGRSFCCPLCKADCNSDDVTPVKFVARQIGALQVKCSNTTPNKQFIGTETNENGFRSSQGLKQKTETEIGQKRRISFDNENTENKRRKLIENESCEWQGSYLDLENHIKECPLQLISCQHCSTKMLNRELAEHFDKCLKFPLVCEQCNQEDVPRNDMALHISEICPMTVINCDECKQELQRKDKQLHLKTECEESLMECVFYKLGCTEKLKRKNATKHIENASMAHAQLAINNQLKLENTVNELKDEIKSLKAKNGTLERSVNLLLSASDNDFIYFNINYPPPRVNKKLKIKMIKKQQFGTIIGPLQAKFNKQIILKFDGERITYNCTPQWLINERDAEDGDLIDAHYT